VNFAEAGFWFLLGFFVASWIAYKTRLRNQANALRNFQSARTELLRVLETVKELTEVTVTIRDETGELEIETEATPKRKDREGMH